MLRRAFGKIRHYLRINMSSPGEVGEKRAAETTELVDKTKKAKTGRGYAPQGAESGREDRKRKVALLISYNGKGYYGLQVNPGFVTIESELCKALLEVGLIPQDHHDSMQKMSFQRAARTDKGVSAAGNIVSLKMLINVENLVDKLNDHLPAQIRVMDCVRTTNSFNSKNFCDFRTYIYILPTYSFAPVEEKVTLDYRTNADIIEKVNETLEKFKGTHNFHNFTSGIKPTEQSAQRYITEFECRLPFVRDGVEFCVLSVKGQSFMMHQIRKMIGLAIAIVKGYCGEEAMDLAWTHNKMDVPKAPGLGLVLDKLHYPRYNERFGSDGMHSKIEWSHIKDKLEKFKEEHIFSEIIKEEIEQQSMMSWLATLHVHSYSTKEIWWAKRKAIGARLKSGPSDGEEMDDEPSADKTEDCSTGVSSNQNTVTGVSSNQTDDNRLTASEDIDDNLTTGTPKCEKEATIVPTNEKEETLNQSADKTLSQSADETLNKSANQSTG